MRKPLLLLGLLLAPLVLLAQIDGKLKEPAPPAGATFTVVLLPAGAPASAATGPSSGPPQLLAADWLPHLQALGVQVDSFVADGETGVFYINTQHGQAEVYAILVNKPVPNQEVEHSADYAYWWPEARAVAERHAAHIVLATRAPSLGFYESSVLHSRVTAACLQAQPQALAAYYGSGTLVFSPEAYLEYVQASPGEQGHGMVPLWVYVGFRQEEDGSLSAYTYGLKEFGHLELEVLDSQRDGKALYDFMVQTVAYMIVYKVQLRNGETIGPDAETKYPITVGQARYLEGSSAQIGY